MASPPVRVIVRLPYNRPDDPLPDPPRVEWNQEKERILWEVIAKSRAIQGAGADWKGLSAHLQVPLPYLLYRAQTRYEEGIRGLQDIRGALSPGLPNTNTTAFPVTSPATAHPSNTNEYFPRIPEVASRRLSNSPATPITRPLGVRARLSSLGQHNPRMQKGSVVRNQSLRSNSNGSANGNTLANGSAAMPRPTKKVSSSSMLTLQGARRSRGTPPRLLSPTSSHAASEAGSEGRMNGLNGDDEGSDESEEDEDARREEEEDRRAEEQEALERKLRDLQQMMTKDAIGLVASPKKDRGRMRPLSTSTASLSSAPPSSSRSQQSLSSLSSRSPHGSIPSIPSSPPNPQPLTHWRSHPDTQRRNSYAYEETQSPSPSSPRIASPIPRHLSPPGKSSSPPMVSTGRALGQTHVRRMSGTSARAGGPGWRMDVGAGTKAGGRVSEQGSVASSFSDLSDASLSASALESALMSNIKGGGSRMSSFARSNLRGKRGVR